MKQLSPSSPRERERERETLRWMGFHITEQALKILQLKRTKKYVGS